MADPMESVNHRAEETVWSGSGNVFADLELPHPEEMLAKSKLAHAIHGIIQARGLTQKRAAELMGIDQPKVSKIIRGRLSEFSTEWLLTRILRLGLDIDIVVHTESIAKDRPGAIHVACI
jgi:predicted XRE-type DNA-binding protein